MRLTRGLTRGLAIASASLAVVALAACSSTTSEVSTPTPTTPSATPTPEIIIWAGGVCTARDAFVGKVTDLASTLEFDPNSDQSLSDQFQSQLESKIGELQPAAEDLGAALGKIPLDYNKAGSAFVDIQAKVEAFNAARDQVQQHLDAVRNAANVIEGAPELIKAATAAKDAYQTGMAVISALQDATGAANGDVGDAFAKAPECQ